MSDHEILKNPRVIIIQKLYGNYLNKESELTFPKHRYKKFIKDVVNGTIERKEIIQDLLDKSLKEWSDWDLQLNKKNTKTINNLFVPKVTFPVHFIS